jgi:hypothetical protein
VPHFKSLLGQNLLHDEVDDEVDDEGDEVEVVDEPCLFLQLILV